MLEQLVMKKYIHKHRKSTGDVMDIHSGELRLPLQHPRACRGQVLLNE